MRQGRVLWCIKGRLSWQGLQLPYVPKGSLSLCQLAGVNSWRAWVACWDCWTRPCVHTRITDCVTLGYSEVQVLLRVHRWHALWGQRKLQGSATVGQQSVWHDMTKWQNVFIAFAICMIVAGCRPCIGILHHWWASSGGCHTGFGRPLREQRTGWRSRIFIHGTADKSCSLLAFSAFFANPGCAPPWPSKYGSFLHADSSGTEREAS